MRLEEVMSEEYNYPSFPLQFKEDRFAIFRRALRAGERAPDADVVDLAAGATVTLSAHWQEKDLVLKFGSAT
jgi:hypothetical protein